jgi:hypothetical protein
LLFGPGFIKEKINSNKNVITGYFDKDAKI